jgi:mannose-6-phosphate isomerase-like protein (cupin superfamily)
MQTDTDVQVLDFHPALGLRCGVTTPAAATGGEYVEMDCTADPGMETIVHKHPEADETYQVVSGALDVLFQGEWRTLRAGNTFTVPRGEVHAFRNSGAEAVRFINRHAPALGFQDHLETVHRLVRAGKIRGVGDPRSLIYMCMSAVRHRPDVAVKPPQRVVNLMAGVGRLLGWRLE